MSLNTPKNNKRAPSASPTPRTPNTASSASSHATFTVSSSTSKHVHSMRQQKNSSTKKSQSRTIFKPAMATPFQNLPTQTATLEESEKVIKIVREAIASEMRDSTPAAAPTATPPTPSRTHVTGKRKRDESDHQSDPTTDEAHPSIPGLVVGINAVTRAASAG